MPRKNLSPLFVILFALSLSGCGKRIKITDTEWCGDMGDYGASCFRTLSSGTRDLEKPEWDQVRFGQVCTSAATLAEWKAALMKLCSDSGRCDYETKKLINNFTKKIERRVLLPARAAMGLRQ